MEKTLNTMMHIAFCTDTNYVMPTGVAMTSVCENNKEDEITFHLVITDEGTSSDEVEKKVAPLKDIAQTYGKYVCVYRMEAARLSAFVCTGAEHVSTSAFSRIFLPEILSKDISKVLYLDCDLVCDGSLKDLWNTELPEECPFSAVVDCNYAKVDNYFRAQIPQSALYVNSGVLLMNLDCWRRNNYISLAVNTAIEKKFPYLDQDTLNHLFYSKMLHLPVRYNFQTVILLNGIDSCFISLDNYDEIKQASANPIIVHYLSGNKPWKEEICPLREVWNKYLRKTIWKDLKLAPNRTWFAWTNVYKEFQETYWMDSILFNKGLQPYLRLFRAAVRLKNKERIIDVSSFLLNSLAVLLEKVYNWKR